MKASLEIAMERAARSDDLADLLVAADWLEDQNRPTQARDTREVARLAGGIATFMSNLMDAPLTSRKTRNRRLADVSTRRQVICSPEFGRGELRGVGTRARISIFLSVYPDSYSTRPLCAKAIFIHRDMEKRIPVRACQLARRWTALYWQHMNRLSREAFRE